MSSTRLFGNHIKPACAYCTQGYPGKDDTFLCPRNGVVRGEFSCRHFEYDPLRRVPKQPLPLQRLDREAMSLE